MQVVGSPGNLGTSSVITGDWTALSDPSPQTQYGNSVNIPSSAGRGNDGK